jgi:hypothetical protein
VRATIIGLLRSRWGVALILSVIVLSAVGVARLVGDNSTPPTVSPGNLSEQADQLPSAASFGPDDGVVSAVPSASPSVAEGAAPPAQVAAAFAENWLMRTRSTKNWLDALRPYSTQQLLGEFKDVDPISVPATRITGEVALVTLSETAVQAIIPLDSGQLRLRLVGPDGHWFVDGVDWDRL